MSCSPAEIGDGPVSDPITAMQLPPPPQFGHTVDLHFAVNNMGLCLKTVLYDICQFQELTKSDWVALDFDDYFRHTVAPWLRGEVKVVAADQE